MVLFLAEAPEISQVFLFEVLLVALDEHKETLMPDGRQFTLFQFESHKVLHKSIQCFERHCIFLAQQRLDEETGGS